MSCRQLNLVVSDSSQTCDVALYVADCSLDAFANPRQQHQHEHQQHQQRKQPRTVADGFVQHSFSPVGDSSAVIAEATDPMFSQLLHDASVCAWVQSFRHSARCEAALHVHGWFQSLPDCQLEPVRMCVWWWFATKIS